MGLPRIRQILTLDDVGTWVTLPFYSQDEGIFKTGWVEREVFVVMGIVRPKGTLFIFRGSSAGLRRTKVLMGRKCEAIREFMR